MAYYLADNVDSKNVSDINSDMKSIIKKENQKFGYSDYRGSSKVILFWIERKISPSHLHSLEKKYSIKILENDELPLLTKTVEDYRKGKIQN